MDKCQLRMELEQVIQQHLDPSLTYEKAHDFISALPDDLAAPDIVHQEGFNLAFFEWYSDLENLISIGVADSEQMVFSGIVRGVKSKGSSTFNAEIEPALLSMIRIVELNHETP